MPKSLKEKQRRVTRMVSDDPVGRKRVMILSIVGDCGDDDVCDLLAADSCVGVDEVW
jgi:hypothetical protein